MKITLLELGCAVLVFQITQAETTETAVPTGTPVEVTGKKLGS